MVDCAPAVSSVVLSGSESKYCTAKREAIRELVRKLGDYHTDREKKEEMLHISNIFHLKFPE